MIQPADGAASSFIEEVPGGRLAHGLGSYEAQMIVSLGASHSAARSSLDEPLLQEEGLDDVFDGVTGLSDRISQGFHSRWPARVVFNERAKIAPVERI